MLFDIFATMRGYLTTAKARFHARHIETYSSLLAILRAFISFSRLTGFHFPCLALAIIYIASSAPDIEARFSIFAR